MSENTPSGFASREKRPALSSRPRSFADQEIAKQGHLIHKLKAKDTTGRWAYYFVLVPKAKESAFLSAIGGEGTIDLEDFGRVIASCYGQKPTQEIVDMLRERYGFEA